MSWKIYEKIMRLRKVSKLKVKVTPLSWFCLAEILPLCKSMTFLDKARPTPLPPAGVLFLN